MSGEHHRHSAPLPEIEQRVKDLENLLIEKGLVDPAAMDELVDTYEHRVGPRNGARVVARAWTDPDYKAWLLEDATAAIMDMGYAGRQGEHMQVVENTDKVHNMVVCTLCSCYPWPVLGLPPAWYKASSYRARAVREPRAVLKEFGVELDAIVAATAFTTSDPYGELVGLRDWIEGALPVPTASDLVATDAEMLYDVYEGTFDSEELFTGEAPYRDFGAGLIALDEGGAPVSRTPVDLRFALSVPKVGPRP